MFMKKILLITLLFSLTLPLFAQDLAVVSDFQGAYKNIREGDSALIKALNEADRAALYNNYKKGSSSLERLKLILGDAKKNRCATKFVESIENEFNVSANKDIELAILGLRLDDSIDDIAAGILIKASRLSSPVPHPISKDQLTAEEEDKAMEIFSTKTKEIKNKSLCMEDTYRSLVASLLSEAPKFGKNIKHIHQLALEQNLISESDFRLLEKMRYAKVHEWPLTLFSYGQRVESVSKKFPTRIKEASELVTDISEGKFRHKKSLRQSLYEKYNTNQIILLANMVRDLKKRLEAKDINIMINYVDQPSEVLALSPMEKFRFILKLLRKELALINNSSLLNGNKASYIDIIAASYEVGYISAAEIEVLSSLEDIWNPKKSTKEKVMVWAKRFGGVASVLLPPPFGFVSVLAIMLIDQYISEAPIDRDPDYNLF